MPQPTWPPATGLLLLQLGERALRGRPVRRRRCTHREHRQAVRRSCRSRRADRRRQHIAREPRAAPCRITATELVRVASLLLPAARATSWCGTPRGMRTGQPSESIASTNAGGSGLVDGGAAGGFAAGIGAASRPRPPERASGPTVAVQPVCVARRRRRVTGLLLQEVRQSHGMRRRRRTSCGNRAEQRSASRRMMRPAVPAFVDPGRHRAPSVTVTPLLATAERSPGRRSRMPAGGTAAAASDGVFRIASSHSALPAVATRNSTSTGTSRSQPACRTRRATADATCCRSSTRRGPDSRAAPSARRCAWCRRAGSANGFAASAAFQPCQHNRHRTTTSAGSGVANDHVSFRGIGLTGQSPGRRAKTTRRCTAS